MNQLIENMAYYLGVPRHEFRYEISYNLYTLIMAPLAFVLMNGFGLFIVYSTFSLIVKSYSNPQFGLYGTFLCLMFGLTFGFMFIWLSFLHTRFDNIKRWTQLYIVPFPLFMALSIICMILEGIFKSHYNLFTGNENGPVQIIITYGLITFVLAILYALKNEDILKNKINNFLDKYFKRIEE